MRVRQWAYNHQCFLRWLLSTVLWRVAARFIEHLDHVGSDKCLRCAASERKTRDQHLPSLNDRRQIFCRKCGALAYVGLGLSSEQLWSTKKCPGKRQPSNPVVEKRTVTIIPMNWD